MLTYESSYLENLEKPQKLEIEVTKKCPLKCVHCSSRSDQFGNENELSLRSITRVISEFSELGGNTVTITGGEPFVRGVSFVIDILKAAKDRSLSTCIYTSGYFMNRSLAKRLRESNANLVCVSIEGGKETHDMITGVAGSFERALMTLRLMKKFEIPTRIQFTPMRINYKEFQQVTQVGMSVGAEAIKVFEFSPQGRARENRKMLELTPREMDEFVCSVTRVIQQRKIFIKYGGLLRGLSNSCSVGKKIAITYEGFALPCLGLQERLEAFNNVGNIEKDQLYEIWKKINKITFEKTCMCNALKNSP